MRVSGVLLVALAISMQPMGAVAYTGEELASGARVNIAQARAIALKAQPGEIADEELETERGGSGLRYTFNIKRGSELYEVGIDAQSGMILENARESND